MATTPLYVSSKTVTIVGCPFSGGQRRYGVDTGPNSLVEADLIQQLEELEWKVHFQGHQQFDDINNIIQQDPDIGKMKQPRAVSEVSKRVAKAVEAASRNGSVPLTLGGDHSLVSIASLH